MEEKESYEYEIYLIRHIKILFKRKWLIVGGTLIFTIAAVVYSFLLPRVYGSEGFLERLY